MRQIITHNLSIKILVFGIAVCLWAYATASEVKTAYFPGDLPVEVKNTPSGLAAIYDQQKVKVKLRASYHVWNQLSADNLHAFVDLQGLQEGTHELEVKVVSDLSGVVVIEKEPAKMIVRLEPVVSKRVPVVVQFQGEVKSGFAVGQVAVQPDSVIVKGARSVVEELSAATALVKLAGEESSVTKAVELAVYSEKGEKIPGLVFEPSSVEVEIPIEVASEVKTVGVKAKLTGQPNPEYFVSQVEIDPATVEISGSNSSLTSINYLETKDLDISGLDHNLEQVVDLLLPVGVRSNPDKVKLKITLKENMLSRWVDVFVIPPLSNSRVSPETIRVALSCPTKVINQVSSADLKVLLDSSEKNVGSYSISLTKEMISAPSSCIITSFLPQTITLTIF